MRLLLSLKPEFAELILSGEKTFEYRRVIPKLPITSVVVYASSPVQRFLGEFEVDEILSGSVADVWSKTKHSAGIPLEQFKTYFSGSITAHALHIVNPWRYEHPLRPDNDFRPPQSFYYMREESYIQIHQRSCALQGTQ